MFWKRKSEETQIEGIEYPKLGERWILKASDGNPWGKTGEDFVVIFDVKDNWIRFGRIYSGKYPASSLSIVDKRERVYVFFSIYQKYIPIPSDESDESK